MKGGIYFMVNKIDGKKYIGSTNNFAKRKYNHFYTLRRGSNRNTPLQEAFNKHGEESFEFNIVAKCQKEDLLKLEQWFLDNSSGKYNISPSSKDTTGVLCSNEKREKIRAKNLGKKMTVNTAEAIYSSRIKDIYQYDLSGTFIKKYNSIVEAAMLTNGSPSGISAVAKRKRCTSGGYQWRYVFVDKVTPTVINQQRPVQCEDIYGNIIGVYKNIAEASRSTGATNLTACLRGKQKTAKGRIFKYINS